MCHTSVNILKKAVLQAYQNVVSKTGSVDASNRFHAESGPSAATATAAVFDTSLVIGALATLATTGSLPGSF